MTSEFCYQHIANVS